ncbi:MAG: Gfo/Idh/MocA family oxidoreductase [Actinobacteria bacterium]|nr:Gfo/Idh/MocA family oxidoreductase [Actinomycetota bacterium]
MTLPTALPLPRTPDPADAPPLNWGILAPGGIALRFLEAARRDTRQRFVAVGSRSAERAAEFAGKHGIDKAYGSYAELVADPEVQAIYVASPHSAHHAHALLALQAGKHVLVEKAFTQDAAQARELVAAAEASKVALMEAMWTRFLPRTDIVRQLLADGALGDLEVVLADHGQRLTHVPRLVRPELAGGALLDLGIYPISYAVFALGLPGRVQATGVLTEEGVDQQVAILLDQFPDHPGAQAVLHTTLAAKTPTTASISGTAARVELPEASFYAPGPVRLTDDTDELSWPGDGQAFHEGMCHEAAHFAQLVADGRTESPLLPLSQTVAIMEIMDEIRAQIGVRYPGE